MQSLDMVSLVMTGVVTGTLAGILGLGGGVFLVPVLVAYSYSPVHAVATSSVPVSVAATSAVIAYFRTGQLRFARALRIGATAAAAAQGGVFLAHYANPRLLLMLFALFIITNIWLMHLGHKNSDYRLLSVKKGIIWNEIGIGLIGGVFSGFFGVGGGVVMVPLLVLLVAEPLKDAVRTSMAVVMFSSISSVAGHALRGSVLWEVGMLLAAGSLVGAQIGVRLLPRLSDLFVRGLFVGMLSILALFTLAKSLPM